MNLAHFFTTFNNWDVFTTSRGAAAFDQKDKTPSDNFSIKVSNNVLVDEESELVWWPRFESQIPVIAGWKFHAWSKMVTTYQHKVPVPRNNTTSAYPLQEPLTSNTVFTKGILRIWITFAPNQPRTIIEWWRNTVGKTASFGSGSFRYIPKSLRPVDIFLGLKCRPLTKLHRPQNNVQICKKQFVSSTSDSRVERENPSMVPCSQPKPVDLTIKYPLGLRTMWPKVKAPESCVVLRSNRTDATLIINTKQKSK